MALFGKKKKEETSNETVKTQETVASEQKAQKEQAVTSKPSIGRDLASVLVRPRITEKAVLGTDRNMYTFEVRRDATKHDIRDAIKAVYEVTPEKIRVVNKKPRHYTSRLRGRKMMDKGLKKAYVYLKTGDRIDLT